MSTTPFEVLFEDDETSVIVVIDVPVGCWKSDDDLDKLVRFLLKEAGYNLSKLSDYWMVPEDSDRE